MLEHSERADTKATSPDTNAMAPDAEALGPMLAESEDSRK
jgi:hypothetical protein